MADFDDYYGEGDHADFEQEIVLGAEELGEYVDYDDSDGGRRSGRGLSHASGRAHHGGFRHSPSSSLRSAEPPVGMEGGESARDEDSYVTGSEEEDDADANDDDGALDAKASLGNPTWNELQQWLDSSGVAADVLAQLVDAGDVEGSAADILARYLQPGDAPLDLSAFAAALPHLYPAGAGLTPSRAAEMSLFGRASAVAEDVGPWATNASVRRMTDEASRRESSKVRGNDPSQLYADDEGAYSAEDEPAGASSAAGQWEGAETASPEGYEEDDKALDGDEYPPRDDGNYGDFGPPLSQSMLSDAERSFEDDHRFDISHSPLAIVTPGGPAIVLTPGGPRILTPVHAAPIHVTASPFSPGQFFGARSAHYPGIASTPKIEVIDEDAPTVARSPQRGDNWAPSSPHGSASPAPVRAHASRTGGSPSPRASRRVAFDLEEDEPADAHVAAQAGEAPSDDAAVPEVHIDINDAPMAEEAAESSAREGEIEEDVGDQGVDLHLEEGAYSGVPSPRVQPSAAKPPVAAVPAQGRRASLRGETRAAAPDRQSLFSAVSSAGSASGGASASAGVPVVRLLMPAGLDVTLACPAGAKAVRSIPIKNGGSAPVAAKLSLELASSASPHPLHHHLTIAPNRFVLPPGRVFEARVHFTPPFDAAEWTESDLSIAGTVLVSVHPNGPVYKLPVAAVVSDEFNTSNMPRSSSAASPSPSPSVPQHPSATSVHASPSVATGSPSPATASPAKAGRTDTPSTTTRTSGTPRAAGSAADRSSTGSRRTTSPMGAARAVLPETETPSAGVPRISADASAMDLDARADDMDEVSVEERRSLSSAAKAAVSPVCSRGPPSHRFEPQVDVYSYNKTSFASGDMDFTVGRAKTPADSGAALASPDARDREVAPDSLPSKHYAGMPSALLEPLLGALREPSRSPRARVLPDAWEGVGARGAREEHATSPHRKTARAVYEPPAHIGVAQSPQRKSQSPKKSPSPARRSPPSAHARHVDERSRPGRPSLHCNRSCVNFGGVPLLSSTTAAVAFKNTSSFPVLVAWSIEPLPAAQGKLCPFSASSGVRPSCETLLPVDKDVSVDVVFQPTSRSVHVAYLRLVASGPKDSEAVVFKIPLVGYGGRSNVLVGDTPPSARGYLVKAPFTAGERAVTVPFANKGDRTAFVLIADALGSPKGALHVTPRSFLLPPGDVREVSVSLVETRVRFADGSGAALASAGVVVLTGDELCRRLYVAHVARGWPLHEAFKGAPAVRIETAAIESSGAAEDALAEELSSRSEVSVVADGEGFALTTDGSGAFYSRDWRHDDAIAASTGTFKVGVVWVRAGEASSSSSMHPPAVTIESESIASEVRQPNTRGQARPRKQAQAPTRAHEQSHAHAQRDAHTGRPHAHADCGRRGGEPHLPSRQTAGVVVTPSRIVIDADATTPVHVRIVNRSAVNIDYEIVWPASRLRVTPSKGRVSSHVEGVIALSPVPVDASHPPIQWKGSVMVMCVAASPGAKGRSFQVEVTIRGRSEQAFTVPHTSARLAPVLTPTQLRQIESLARKIRRERRAAINAVVGERPSRSQERADAGVPSGNAPRSDKDKAPLLQGVAALDWDAVDARGKRHTPMPVRMRGDAGHTVRLEVANAQPGGLSVSLFALNCTAAQVEEWALRPVGAPFHRPPFAPLSGLKRAHPSAFTFRATSGIVERDGYAMLDVAFRPLEEGLHSQLWELHGAWDRRRQSAHLATLELVARCAGAVASAAAPSENVPPPAHTSTTPKPLLRKSALSILSPSLAAQPRAIAFPQAAAGALTTRHVTLSNHSDGPVEAQISPPPEPFECSHTLVRLQPGASVRVSVTFAPVRSGWFTGTVHIEGSDGCVVDIPLYGETDALAAQR